MQMESELLMAQRRRQVLQLKEDKGLAGTRAARRAGQPVQAAPRAGQPGQAAPRAGLQDRARLFNRRCQVFIWLSRIFI